MATGDAGELITYARAELLARIRGAKERVWLASPFLSKPVAEQIAAAVEESTAGERRLLTALVASSVQVRALDPGALEVLLDWVGLPQSLEEILTEDELTALGRDYWVKSNYQRWESECRGLFLITGEHGTAGRPRCGLSFAHSAAVSYASSGMCG